VDTRSFRPVPYADLPETRQTPAPAEEPPTGTDPDANTDFELRTKRPEAPIGYELFHRLGGGGMGDVYLADDLTTNKRVAMKFLQAPNNPVAVERFLIEVRALAKIDHPHIVRVFAHDFYRSVPFFTMEYAEGGTLADRVKKDGPLDPIEAAGLIITVARAMTASHAANVIHRDLKPSNILLAKDGTPKVSDFGLAKRADVDDGLTTQSGPIGTLGFMPPEQVSSRHGEITKQSDVYGLGATLYYLLTGRPPFKGEQAEVLTEVVNALPNRVRAIRAEVPWGLEAIVHKCLAKKAKDRYQTMADLAADLERFVAGKTPLAPQLTRVRRLRQWAVRHRTRLAGAAVAVVAATVLVWVGVLLAAPTDHLKKMQKDLAAGRRVELIGATGLPKWHNWVLGSPELVLNSDGICSFEANGQSMLELCPDPMCEHYMIRAEIQFTQTKLLFQPANPNGANPPAQIAGTTIAGVYCGYGATPGNGGAAHTALMAVFNDAPPLLKQANGRPTTSDVRFRRWGLFLGPNQLEVGYKTNLGHIQFVPAAGQTGPWRTIEIEVSPERVLCWWQQPDGTKALFADRTFTECRAVDARFLDELNAKVPNHGIMNLPLSSRMPIGIWNERASISLRNVSVTPLP
jgi:eukaryotic-like serine/threonine-protein kinase